MTAAANAASTRPSTCASWSPCAYGVAAAGSLPRTAELYYKQQNYFDSTSMRYKAGECAFALKEYEKAVEHFTKSAELSFLKGFDRFGVSALEYAKDCFTALKDKKKVKELEKKIKEVKCL